MDIIGQNGNDGLHYENKIEEPKKKEDEVETKEYFINGVKKVVQVKKDNDENKIRYF